MISYGCWFSQSLFIQGFLVFACMTSTGWLFFHKSQSMCYRQPVCLNNKKQVMKCSIVFVESLILNACFSVGRGIYHINIILYRNICTIQYISFQGNVTYIYRVHISAASMVLGLAPWWQALETRYTSDFATFGCYNAIYPLHQDAIYTTASHVLVSPRLYCPTSIFCLILNRFVVHTRKKRHW